MQIIVIDSSKDITEQLREVSEINNLPLLTVMNAYHQRKLNITSSDQRILPDLFFDIKDLKPEYQEPEPKHNYQEVKKRNKFFN